MAKRRKKKEDPVGALVGLVVVGGFLGTFAATKSLVAAVFALILIFVIVIAVLIMIGIQRRERLKRSGIAEVDKMDGHKFEHYLSHLFRSQGYNTEVTRAAGDYGVDLLLTKKGKKIAVQAKRYKGNVGLEAVQQVQAGKAHYRASEAWVVTNSGYTDQAYSLAKSNGVRLIARKELIEMMLKMNAPAKRSGTEPGSISKVAAVSSPKKDNMCGLCGGTMSRRNSNRGEVYACSNYPGCKNIQAI